MTQNIKTTGLMALALTAFVAAATTPTYAAFTSVSKVANTASAVLTGAGTISATVVVKNRSNNAAATSIVWTGATAGGGWLLADQYIQLNTNITAGSGAGVQIYTDNMAVAASPKFTGNPSVATPAGLIGSADTTQKLPTAWRAATTTGTVTTALNPNANAGESYAWLFHKDKSQVAIPTSNATAWQNGEDFVTVYKAGAGVHFGQAPTEFGGFKVNDVTYIYTSADFLTATTPNTYSTNQLIVEAYTL